MRDGEIVDLFFARDERALSVTAEKYGKKLAAISERIVGDKETAKECENDVYLKAWNAIPPNEPRDNLFAFLAKIARNVSINAAKSFTREKRSALFSELTEELESVLPSEEDVEEAADVAELGRIISDFLRGVSAEKRNIFIRRYWYADSVSEIAERFSISEGKVKTALFRTRNELKKRLEKEGYKP